MPLLIKDATMFALRGQKRQRSEDNKGTQIYTVRINDDGYDFQLVPSGSVDIRVIMEPLAVGEGRFIMSLGINQDLFNELARVEAGLKELLLERYPEVAWQSALRPADETWGAALRIKFYDDLQIYDENGELTKAPKAWRSSRVVPILNLKVWTNEKDASAWWTMAAVKIAKPEPRAFNFI